jgi:L-lactate dehydrogenase (cytochrome)
MRNVKDLDLSTTILGQHSSLPVFIAPAALAKLAHPDGECGLARGAGETGIIQMVSSSASMTPEAIASSRVTDTQCQLYQLYVVSERHRTEDILRRVKQAGYKGLVLTVDTAVLGKRERDERYKATLISETDEKPKPLGFTHGGWLTPTLCWDDLQWIREIWDRPIAVKGIMTAEDALIATQHGVQAIYLSNHGGRQLDTSPPSLMTLLEIRRYCPEIIEKVEIYLDGGFRRGNDVIKALALGARACGLGRPFMYALGAYGHEGVVRAVDGE